MLYLKYRFDNRFDIARWSDRYWIDKIAAAMYI
jgi:hypothetical protein